MITLKIKCEKHPDYKAVQRPRAACAACMHIYKLAGTVKLLPVHGDLFCNPQWDGSELHFEHDNIKATAEEPKKAKKKKKASAPNPVTEDCPDCGHAWCNHYYDSGCDEWNDAYEYCNCERSAPKQPKKRGRK